METEDILHIHEKILKYFSIEKENMIVYNELIQILLHQALNCTVPYGINNEKTKLEVLSNKYKITDKIKKKKIEEITYREYKNIYEFVTELENHISNFSNEESIYYYNTGDILDQYKDELNKPQKSSFIGTEESAYNNIYSSKYNEIIDSLKEKKIVFYTERLVYYLKKYRMLSVYTVFNPFDMEIKNSKKKTKKKYYCECFEKGEDSSGNIVCKTCGNIYNEVEDTVNYHDYSRVNMVQRYHYEKRCHFRDTINQFQGKQNKYIPEKVFEDIRYMIEMHGLEISKVTINHINMFLSETGNSKYYEDKQLIYSIITKKEKPDISKYEKKLFEDFEKLVEVFLKIKGKRKNFLHAHYVLTQLLLRQGVKLPENSLNSLRTPARLREHDDIYEKCCDLLGWNFTPLA